jgi:hypothetical protein
MVENLKGSYWISFQNIYNLVCNVTWNNKILFEILPFKIKVKFRQGIFQSSKLNHIFISPCNIVVFLQISIFWEVHVFEISNWALITMEFITFLHVIFYHLTNGTTWNYKFNIIEWIFVNFSFFKKWAT